MHVFRFSDGNVGWYSKLTSHLGFQIPAETHLNRQLVMAQCSRFMTFVLENLIIFPVFKFQPGTALAVAII